VKTLAARRRIRHYDPLADSPLAGSAVRTLDFGLWTLEWLGVPHFADGPGQFVPEGRRRHDHPRMIAALEDFEVGAAGQGGLDLNPHLARFEGSQRNLFNPKIFFAIKHSGFHQAH
jgi:hypothetical protein